MYSALSTSINLCTEGCIVVAASCSIENINISTCAPLLLQRFFKKLEHRLSFLLWARLSVMHSDKSSLCEA